MRPSHRPLLPFLLAVSIFLLSSCSVLGITKPLTFDEKLGAAYTAHTTIVQTTDAALLAGIITGAQGDKVVAMANTSRSILDAARVAEKTGNATGATSQLQLATDALTALQAFLTTSQKTAAAKPAPAKGV
jgi:hypothetical protein